MSMANRFAFSKLRNISSGGRVMLLSMVCPLVLLWIPPQSAMVAASGNGLILRARRAVAYVRGTAPTSRPISIRLHCEACEGFSLQPSLTHSFSYILLFETNLINLINI